MRFVPRRAFGALVIAAFAVVVLTGATAFAGSSGKGGGGLSKHDRALLAQAKADGKGTVIVIIASKSGANRDVVKSIEAQGGSILNRDDSLGYVLARVATDKVQAVAALDSIEGIDLDEIIPLEDPRPEGSVDPDAADAAGRGDSAREPLHADRRHRRGAVRRLPTRPGTGAASRSASSTRASRSTTRA